MNKTEFSEFFVAQDYYAGVAYRRSPVLVAMCMVAKSKDPRGLKMYWHDSSSMLFNACWNGQPIFKNALLSKRTMLTDVGRELLPELLAYYWLLTSDPPG